MRGWLSNEIVTRGLRHNSCFFYASSFINFFHFSFFTNFEAALRRRKEIKKSNRRSVYVLMWCELASIDDDGDELYGGTFARSLTHTRCYFKAKRVYWKRGKNPRFLCLRMDRDCFEEKWWFIWRTTVMCVHACVCLCVFVANQLLVFSFS